MSVIKSYDFKAFSTLLLDLNEKTFSCLLILSSFYYSKYAESEWDAATSASSRCEHEWIEFNSSTIIYWWPINHDGTSNSSSSVIARYGSKYATYLKPQCRKRSILLWMTNTTHTAFTSFLNCCLLYARLFIYWQQHEANEHHNVFNTTTGNNNNNDK